MKWALGLLALLLPVPGMAAQPRASEDAQFRHWLVMYLTNDPNDSDLQNLVFGYALVDLNGDGRNEAVAWARDANLCGTSGCAFSVFVHDKSGWRLFSDGTTTRPPFKILPTRTHGWHDISSLQYGGGVEHPFEAWDRFDGKRDYWSNAKVPRHVHGRIIIRDATIPLFPDKCRKVTDEPSVFGPIPIDQGKPGSC